MPRSRAKGVRFERETALWLRSVTTGTASRTAPLQASGGSEPDVLCVVPGLDGAWRLGVECKRLARWSMGAIYDALDQAARMDCDGGLDVRAVRVKADRQDPIWVLTDAEMEKLICQTM